MEEATYADVVVPLSFGGVLTYELAGRVEDETSLAGRRVVVPVGRKRLYTGVILRCHKKRPEGVSIKRVLAIADSVPIFDAKVRELWRWISEYYLATPGEVLRVAVTPSLLPGSETVISLPDEMANTPSDKEEERALIGIIRRSGGSMPVASLPVEIGGKNCLKVVEGLINRGLIIPNESVRGDIKERHEEWVGLSSGCHGMSRDELMSRLSRAPRQREVLACLLDKYDQNSPGHGMAMSLRALSKSCRVAVSVVRELEKKGIVAIGPPPDSSPDRKHSAPANLSEHQMRACEEIKEQFRDRNTVLLHGVTSSGKTEIYFRLIEQELGAGKQVLYMVPEIALTGQLIERVSQRLGVPFAPYHSRLSAGEKVRVWRGVSANGSDRIDLVVGVRSALFLPFRSLGLIIVDEEHDTSYKQQDPAPRYSARDLSAVVAGLHGGKVLLGSATPSLESYYNAVTGKYGFAELTERYGSVEMPEVILSDTRKASRKKKMVSHFSPELIALIDEALAKGEQVMLFRNRRGFSTWVECRSCGDIPGCKTCSVKLTYHRGRGALICHYCGFKSGIPASCSGCGSPSYSTIGYGTEKIEDELKLLFPDAVIDRMDRDTTSGKEGFSSILGRFGRGETDILVGTQMISKGHDFSQLSLIGVLNTDAILNYSDFRAYERCFQLVGQVSGRAGRRGSRGKVVIQTSDPSNPLLQMLKNHDYRAMYEMQMRERELFGYPPFTRVVRVDVRAASRELASEVSALIAARFRTYFGKRVMGPEAPPVERVRNHYIMSLLLKLERERALKAAKEYIVKTIKLINSEYGGRRGVRVSIDVDPQ